MCDTGRSLEASESTEQEWRGTPIITVNGEPLVRCGTPVFPVSAMSGGVDGLVDRAEVVAGLERLEDAEWFVLGRSGDMIAVATGHWDRNGPGKDGQILWMDNEDGDGWRFSGSSDPAGSIPCCRRASAGQRLPPTPRLCRPLRGRYRSGSPRRRLRARGIPAPT